MNEFRFLWGLFMVRIVKHLIIVSLFINNTLFSMQTSGVEPMGMQPSGAVAVSQTGLVNYAPKPNIKYVTTNSSEVEASIIDLSDSMPASQRRIFEDYGLIPMSVIVKNNSDKTIHVAPKVLDYGLGLSIENVKDAIIKKLKLKKYGTYASIMVYRAMILAALITTGLYFPYESASSLSSGLLDCVTSFGAPLDSVYSLFSQIPAGIKFATGVTSMGLAMVWMDPSMLVVPFHALIDKYYRVKSRLGAPYSRINEFNQAIDFVVTSSSNKNFDIVSKSSKQFVIFVKSADATAIKNATTFPVLKFE